jgi:hypothetical protein
MEIKGYGNILTMVRLFANILNFFVNRSGSCRVFQKRQCSIRKGSQWGRTYIPKDFILQRSAARIKGATSSFSISHVVCVMYNRKMEGDVLPWTIINST